MQRVFLDANVLFSAAYRPRNGLLRLWKRRRVRLVTSAYAAEEARSNLHQEMQLAALAELLEGVEVMPEIPTGMLPANVRLPEKDRPILLSAIRAGAAVLLTGDKKHFGWYFGRKIAGVRVLTPGEFLKSRQRGAGIP